MSCLTPTYSLKVCHVKIWINLVSCFLYSWHRIKAKTHEHATDHWFCRQGDLNTSVSQTCDKSSWVDIFCAVALSFTKDNQIQTTTMMWTRNNAPNLTSLEAYQQQRRQLSRVITYGTPENCAVERLRTILLNVILQDHFPRFYLTNPK